ncbi:MAG: FAD-dependent oxidoreductase [Cyanobacterium sp. T60_A2020_053]|nr:FAD-dependent oxidoreductase [Cyanobacterium sp. T60_A2020_053]
MNKLVLLGGGHSHVVALKLWYQKPLENIEIILISDVEKTPYSGMLPAHLANYYTFDETHINLVKLAKKYGFKLIIDTVINIDAINQQVIVKSGQKINYNLLSIDIGCTPEKSHIMIADNCAIPAKPVPQLLQKWQEIINYCQKNPTQKLIINIVGGGAGGVELALNMHHRFNQITDNFSINLLTKGDKLVKIHNDYASYKLTETLREKRINIYFNSEVNSIFADHITTTSGLVLSCNYTFLVTNGVGAQWLKQTDITTDEKGFILIKDTLQSISHSNIFATGDIATMVNYSYPKAGVFAVRQGKSLAQNWRNWWQNKPLKSDQPQSLYLSLIGLGGRRALMIWGYLGFDSPLLWYWKEFLDRRFIRVYSDSR